jgi:hypothetical protein
MIIKAAILFLATLLHPDFRQETALIDAPNGKKKESGTEYKLLKIENNIFLYSKWIPVDDTRMARRLKIIFIVEGSVSAILTELRHDDHFPLWMKNCKTYYRVRTVNPDEWYSYVQFSVPWPLYNQDLILHYMVQDHEEKGIIRIHLEGIPDLIKKFDRVTRILHFEGDWIMQELENNRIRVKYSVFTNVKPSYPLWITDPIIQNNLLKSMNAFREKVRGKY